jgi:HSP20 family protein
MNSLVLYDNNPFDLMERFFNDDDWFFTPKFRTPAIDVYEEGDKYMLEAELPGLTEKDIKLEVRGGQLTLSTSKNEKSEEKSKKGWIRRERREFRFVRSFTLPEDVDAQAIEAHFKNGVLQVVMPKKPEAAPKTIEVKIA